MSDPAPTLRLNGRAVGLAGVPGPERLLDSLRWRWGLRGTKEGCRSGACGACTVLIDGRPALSCLLLTQDLRGTRVETIEGLDEDPDAVTVRSAFGRAGALQCGYCTPGFVVALVGRRRALGREASAEALLAGLDGNLCRCTGYASIDRAVRLLGRSRR